MNTPQTDLPANPARVQAFADFFKRYMSVSAVVTAALPIPVTVFGLIPTYGFQTKFLSVYTSLFCFLILAFIFYSRHALAPPMFFSARPRIIIAGLPLLLIVISLIFVALYHGLLGYSFRGKGMVDFSRVEEWDVDAFVAAMVMLLYIGIFVAAEAAFVLMAIKEYLQDYLKLTDRDLIFPRQEPQD